MSTAFPTAVAGSPEKRFEVRMLGRLHQAKVPVGESQGRVAADAPEHRNPCLIPHRARRTADAPGLPPSWERGRPARADNGGIAVHRGLEARAPRSPCSSGVRAPRRLRISRAFQVFGSLYPHGGFDEELRVAVAPDPVVDDPGDVHVRSVAREAVDDGGGGGGHRARVDHQHHRPPEGRRDVRGRAFVRGRAVEEAHDALDDDEVRILRRRPDRGREGRFAHGPRVDVEARPPARRGVERGVDVVRPHLERRSPHPSLPQVPQQGQRHRRLPAPRRRRPDHESPGHREPAPGWPPPPASARVAASSLVRVDGIGSPWACPPRERGRPARVDVGKPSALGWREASAPGSRSPASASLRSGGLSEEPIATDGEQEAEGDPPVERLARLPEEPGADERPGHENGEQQRRRHITRRGRSGRRRPSSRSARRG